MTESDVIATQRQEIEALRVSLQEQNTKIMALQSQVQTVTRAGEYAAKRGDEVIGHLHKCLDDLGGFCEQMIRDLVPDADKANSYREELQGRMPARVG